jgi:hypothetical protein
MLKTHEVSTKININRQTPKNIFKKNVEKLKLIFGNHKNIELFYNFLNET